MSMPMVCISMVTIEWAEPIANSDVIAILVM